jgi:hypothetical protein
MPYYPRSSQVMTTDVNGFDRRYLGEYGITSGLQYSYAVPGGPDQMTCNLVQPPAERFKALDPGRLVRIYRGGTLVWNGKMNEPVPSTTGWQLQAYGSGHFGDDFDSIYTTYSTPGDPVDQAITRGLAWKDPTSGWPGGLYLSQPPDSGSVTITDYMNNITAPAGYVWQISRRNVISLFQPTATAPNRILVVTVPQARTLAGYYTTLYVRYQSQAQSTSSTSGGSATFGLTSVTNTAQAAKHGVKEIYADWSSVGTMTAGAVQTQATLLMEKYQAANYAGQFTVTPGQLRNIGGAPCDLGTEQAGSVVSVILSSGAYGGDVLPVAPPIQFLVGAYAYDDDNNIATITPYLGAASDLGTLLSNFATIHTPNTVPSGGHGHFKH